MKKDAKKVSLIGVIWKVAFGTLKSNPVILAPFLISSILKLLGLFGIFFAIFYPLSIVFVPIIRAIWGEVYLHYPFNFVLMPKLFYYVHSFLYIFIDGLLTSMAVWMIFQVNEGQRPNLKEAFKKVLPKYFTVTGFLLSIFLIAYGISLGENIVIIKLLKIKFVASLMQSGILDFVRVFMNFFLVVLLEMVFAFAIPFAVLDNKRFFRGIGRSFKLAKKFFGTTFVLIFIPTCIMLPFSLLKIGFSVLMDKSIPEIVMVILGLSTVFAFLVDSIVTTSLTFLFLSKKDEQVEVKK